MFSERQILGFIDRLAGAGRGAVDHDQADRCAPSVRDPYSAPRTGRCQVGDYAVFPDGRRVQLTREMVDNERATGSIWGRSRTPPPGVKWLPPERRPALNHVPVTPTYPIGRTPAGSPRPALSGRPAGRRGPRPGVLRRMLELKAKGGGARGSESRDPALLRKLLMAKQRGRVKP